MEGVLEDRLLTIDKENALNRMLHGQLQPEHEPTGQNGVLTQVVKSAVLRNIADCIVPDRQTITGRVPFQRQDIVGGVPIARTQ